MKLILSSITYGRAHAKERELYSELEPKLKSAFADKEYSSFESMAIIPVIVPDELFEGQRERVLRQHKLRSADVRMRIPYDAFCNANYEKRRLIYIDHLVVSVLALKSRMKNNKELKELYDIADTINSVR